MANQDQPQLYIVHCVDTEGPLNETLEATFERLRENKDIDLPPDAETLTKLQNKELDLGGRENEIADYVHPKRLAYLHNWDLVGEMLSGITSEDFRFKHADPLGNPYTFTWFLIDIVGYKNNPRSKSVGFHGVWDKFFEIVDQQYNDAYGWHFHTVPSNKNAVEYNTCWTNNDWPEQSICKRLIEREHFPALFRAGGHIERNDLSFWLEQFIPFDFSCRSYGPKSDIQYQAGDINDWRGAPSDWSPYHPCFYDYRKPGDMKRWIFRALDIDSNACQLDEAEVTKAFTRARKTPTVLAISTHDRRDMKPEIEHVMNLVNTVSQKHPDVQWAHANALEAARGVLHLAEEPALELHAEIKNNILHVQSNTPIFGPTPFLAIKEGEDLFYRDNFTIESNTSWAYKIPDARNITTIGVGASNNKGDVATCLLKEDAIKT